MSSKTKTEFRKAANAFCGERNINSRDAIIDFRNETGVKNNTNWNNFKHFVQENQRNLRKRDTGDSLINSSYHASRKTLPDFMSSSKEDYDHDNSWDAWCSENYPEEWYED